MTLILKKDFLGYQKPVNRPSFVSQKVLSENASAYTTT